MPLQATGSPPAYMTVLSPPGNLASELEAYRREFFRVLGSPGALAFPCAAPLSVSRRPPDEKSLSAIASSAPRMYDRLVTESGFLLLSSSAAGGNSQTSDVLQVFEDSMAAVPVAESDIPFPVGLGFPLAFFPEARTAVAAAARLPPPPRLSFKTFLAVVLEIRWSTPWTSGLVWKPVASLRYPLRILKHD